MRSQVSTTFSCSQASSANGHPRHSPIDNWQTTQRNSAQSHARDPLRTVSFAENALCRIKALNLPADPPSFELWYTYETGQNPVLNQAINEARARNGLLSVDDLDQIYDRHLSPTRFADAVDQAGAEISREVDQISALLDAATSSAMSYRHQFTDANEKLEKPIDHRTLRSIIESLLVAGKRAEQENRALEARLQASKREIQNLQTKLHIARCESLTDPLTQITSRKGFDQALETGITKAELARKPLSLLLIDIDHFKRFNDTFGHLVGDSVLRLVASVINESVKGQDTAARYGGEEFAVILPNTSLADATTVAENIRTAVMSKEMMVRSTGQRLGRITISIGVAELHIDEFGKSLIARADRCLYAAKERGRNQVVNEREVERNAAAAVNCSTRPS